MLYIKKFRYHDIKLSISINRLAGALAAAGGELVNPNAAGVDEDEKKTLRRHYHQLQNLTGAIAIISPALAFAFACRNSVWIFLTGLPFERSLIWHKLFSYLTVIIGKSYILMRSLSKF